MGLYGAWLIDRLVHRHRSARVPVGLVLPLALYVGVATLSLFVAADVGLYARGLVLLVQMFLLYVYLVGTIRTRQDVRFVVCWLLYGLVCEGLIIALSAVGAVFARRRAYRFGRTPLEEFGMAARFAGTVGSPILAAGYLEMHLAPALAILVTNLGRYYKTLAVLGLSLGSVALIGTFSRGGWLAASLSLTIVYFLLWRRRRLSPAVPVCSSSSYRPLRCCSMRASPVVWPAMIGGSARSRVPLMIMAWDIITDRPVLGVGANNYTEALRPRTARVRQRVAVHRSQPVPARLGRDRRRWIGRIPLVPARHASPGLAALEAHRPPALAAGPRFHRRPDGPDAAHAGGYLQHPPAGPAPVRRRRSHRRDEPDGRTWALVRSDYDIEADA